MLDSFINSTNAVLPLFIMMACGFLARRAHVLDRVDVTKMNKVAFKIFIPLMVTYNLYSSDVSTAFNPALIGYVAAAVLAEYVLALLYAVRFVEKPDQRGVVIQAMYRSNVTLIGLQLLANLIPNADLGPLCTASAVTTPIFNTLAVITLEVYSGKKPDGKKLALDVIKNPLILGCAAGTVLMLLKIPLPYALEASLRDMAKVAAPLSVFLLGAFFQFGNVREHIGPLVAATVARLIVLPGIFLGLGAVLGFRGIYFATMIPIFASSTAVPSFTMVQQMGGDADLAGDIVVATNVFCTLSIFFWCFLFQALKIF